MNSEYRIKVIENEACLEWERFLTILPNAHYEQSSLFNYGETGWIKYLLLVYKDEILQGGIKIKVKEFPVVGEIGVVTQGPHTISSKIDEYIVKQSKKFTKDYKLAYLVFDIHYCRHDLKSIFRSNNFHIKSKYLPEREFHSATTIIDLTQSEKDILTKMNSGRRRNIKKGLRKDFEFVEGGREDLFDLFELMKQVCRRRNVKPVPAMVETFTDIWDAMNPEGFVKLFLTKSEGVTVCAMFCFSYGDTFSWWKWGWSSEFSDANFTSAVMWRTIIWAKENGFKNFDFVQLDPKVAEAVINKNELTPKLTDQSFYGPTIFKMRFGGNVIFYPGVFIYYPSIVSFFKAQVILALNYVRIKVLKC